VTKRVVCVCVCVCVCVWRLMAVVKALFDFVTKKIWV
jgi:hypothetical protein